MGSLKSPCTTCYRSSIETIALNCLVFEKIAFLHFGDRQTDEQMDSIDALSRCRCRERRLNKAKRSEVGYSLKEAAAGLFVYRPFKCLAGVGNEKRNS